MTAEFASSHATPSHSDDRAKRAARAAVRLSDAFEAALAASSDGASVDACLRSAAVVCRDALALRWARTQAADQLRGNTRRVHYLSMEFLMGRALSNSLSALGLDDAMRAQMRAHGQELSDVLEREHDAALGNGGLGRLAACFLDSFATLGLPSFGYGLRYEYGMFAQHIQEGRQVEEPDDWLRNGNPWEILRPELRYKVSFGGRVESDGAGRRWVPAEKIVATAYDFIIPGHNTERVSTLRQWHASAERSIDFGLFCRGDYQGAGAHRQAADVLNWVLYPDDSTQAGRELRLKQEYFLVSASIQDMVARHLSEKGRLETLGRYNIVHLNDTHPALAPAELMRVLVDEHGVPWDEAWTITRQAVSYTNHTLMPEALETWPVRMFEALLPRHLEIIFQINQQFLNEVLKRFPGDDAMAGRVSLIDESGERRVRMAALSIVASNHVNGVSALHSDLMVRTIFADYAKLYPERFLNVTNGVTPRRWLAQANPGFGMLLDKTIGKGWRNDLSGLAALQPRVADPDLGREFLRVKRENKEKLATLLRREVGVIVNPDSLFDIQIKRIHEYKRQLLNLLHVVSRYQAIIANPHADWVPRTVIFGGKAASAYYTAKMIIQLIHDVARVINSDPRIGDKLKLVYVPNYGVSWAEALIPAADLSEQISTAGTEASGTGNMKFAMNGALTIGTWDGANIEMAEAMGEENMFVFGLRADGVARMKSLGYDPRLYVEANVQLKQVIDAIGRGDFCWHQPDRFRSLIDPLMYRDAYMLMADFADYVATQSRVDALFRDPVAWSERALRNVAAMGIFSSDRTIRDYQHKVWALPDPV